MQTAGALHYRWPHWTVPGHRLHDCWRRRSNGHGSRGQLPDVRHGSSWRRYHTDKRSGDQATAILTRAFPKRARRALGNSLFEKAWNYLYKVSTVEDALTASIVGVRQHGVTAMHDATEGGVIAGLIELTTASKLGLIVDLELIQISEETRHLCKLFRIDPLVCLSEGSLIIASRPTKTNKILAKLSSRGIPSSIVGSLTRKFRGCKATTSKGLRNLNCPSVDPYWKAYSKAVNSGWS